MKFIDTCIGYGVPQHVQYLWLQPYRNTACAEIIRAQVAWRSWWRSALLYLFTLPNSFTFSISQAPDRLALPPTTPHETLPRSCTRGSQLYIISTPRPSKRSTPPKTCPLPTHHTYQHAHSAVRAPDASPHLESYMLHTW